jgi:hypothetical protein
MDTLYLPVMQRFGTLMSIFFPAMLLAQDMVLQQGTVTVMPGTNLEIQGAVTWNITSGTQVVNDGTIHLRNGAGMNEVPGAPIVGSGTEHAYVEGAILMTDHAPGGLGLLLTSDAPIGPMEVVRGHLPQTMANGQQSVSRWFELMDPPQTPIQNLAFRYDQTELNGLDESVLDLFDHDPQYNYWLPMSAANTPGQLVSTNVLPRPVITAFHEDAALAIPAEKWIDLNVWPTVTSSTVKIALPDNVTLETLQVFDASGRSILVTSQVLANDVVQIDVSSAAPGMLFLQLNGSYVTKIIKQ